MWLIVGVVNGACLRILGHSPGPECRFGLNRESYSLSAGLALGMIGLAVIIINNY